MCPDKPGRKVNPEQFMATVIRERAERLGLPKEQVEHSVPDEPRFLRSARRRAEASRRSVEEVLEEDLQRLAESDYPRPECLQPHEVELFAAGELSEERRQHLASCNECSDLVGHLEADGGQVEEVVRLVARAGALQGEAASQETEFNIGRLADLAAAYLISDRGHR